MTAPARLATAPSFAFTATPLTAGEGMLGEATLALAETPTPSLHPSGVPLSQLRTSEADLGRFEPPRRTIRERDQGRRVSSLDCGGPEARRTAWSSTTSGSIPAVPGGLSRQTSSGITAPAALSRRSSSRHGRSATFARVTGHGGPRDQEAAAMRQVKVWDLVVRVFHWALALAVLAAFLSSEKDVPVHAMGASACRPEAGGVARRLGLRGVAACALRRLRPRPADGARLRPRDYRRAARGPTSPTTRWAARWWWRCSRCSSAWWPPARWSTPGRSSAACWPAT